LQWNGVWHSILADPTAIPRGHLDADSAAQLHRQPRGRCHSAGGLGDRRRWRALWHHHLRWLGRMRSSGFRNRLRHSILVDSTGSARWRVDRNRALQLHRLSHRRHQSVRRCGRRQRRGALWYDTVRWGFGQWHGVLVDPACRARQRVDWGRTLRIQRRQRRQRSRGRRRDRQWRRALWHHGVGWNRDMHRPGHIWLWHRVFLDATDICGRRVDSNGSLQLHWHGSFANIVAITMETSTNVLEAVPSGLSSDGSSFSVTWDSQPSTTS